MRAHLRAETEHEIAAASSLEIVRGVSQRHRPARKGQRDAGAKGEAVRAGRGHRRAEEGIVAEFGEIEAVAGGTFKAGGESGEVAGGGGGDYGVEFHMVRAPQFQIATHPS